MHYLIDGYNLLFAAGFEGQEKIEPGTLDRARRTLMDLITSELKPAELSASVIVFDAKKPPPNASDGYDYRGLGVRFARNHDDADELIIELIRKAPTPQKLCVVSTDNQIRTVAARRRTKLIASEDWIYQLETAAESTIDKLLDNAAEPERQLRQQTELGADEVAAWLEEFDDAAPPNRREARRVPQPEAKPKPSNNADAKNNQKDKNKQTPPSERQPQKPPRDASEDPQRDPGSHFDWGPFPPGYGEDLE